ncbi:MAG: ATP-grasp domain-containing protein, partial [Rhizomicrobium sp.]
MKTLLVLGAGKEQMIAIALAKHKQIHTIVLDRNPKAEGRAAAGEFHAVSTRDRNAVLEFVRNYKDRIDGVMTIASDIPHIVSSAAEIRGVPHIPVPVAELCVHKLRMKERLQGAEINVPAFASVKGVEELEAFISGVGYPVVIKPVDNSGARGVLRLAGKTDLFQAFAYASRFAFSGEVMAEKFVEGHQISTEGLVLNGILHCTGFADRNYSRLSDADPFMIEDGGDIPTALADAERKKVEAEFE